MPQKNIQIPTRKIVCGILAGLFLITIVRTYSLAQLAVPIDTAYATHTVSNENIDSFKCTPPNAAANIDIDVGFPDSLICTVLVGLNLFMKNALAITLTLFVLVMDFLPWIGFAIVRLAWWIIYELIIGLSSFFILLSTALIQSAVYPTEPIAQALLYNPNLLRNIHTALWIPVRDLVNVGFALLLIIGAILTVVKASKDVIAQYGPKFMIAIILVNFSWFIPRVVLDIANVSAMATFSLAQCTIPNPDPTGPPLPCYTIERVDLSYFICTPTLIPPPPFPPPITIETCPTLLLKVTEIALENAPGAKRAMAGLLKPFQEIFSLKILPQTGSGWDKLNKLLAIFNEVTATSNTDIIQIPNPQPPPPTIPGQNPGYPSGWIGIGNFFECIWSAPTICGRMGHPIGNSILQLRFTHDPLHGGQSSVDFATSFAASWPTLLRATGEFLQQLATGTFRLIILIFLTAIFLILYTFALIALLAIALLRIPIIWLTLGFMPVVALAFVLGRGGIGGFLWGVWDKFVGAAFIPAVIGIPIAAGSLILNIATRPNTLGANGIVENLFGADGIIQITFIIISIIVIWLGVFAAIHTLNFAGAAQQALAGRIRNIGSATAKGAVWGMATKAPIFPFGTVLKTAGAGMAGLGKALQLPLSPGKKSTILNLPAKGIGAAGKWIYGGGLERGAGTVAKGIGSVVGKTRDGIGKVFGTGTWQKIVFGGLEKAATGQLESVLHDYSRGDLSLAEAFRRRFGSQGISRDDAKKAATALGTDPKKGDVFIEAAHALQKDPKDAVAMEKLLNVLEELKKDGIPIDLSRGLPRTIGTIIDEGQADTSNPLNSRFNDINGLALENGLMNAGNVASGSPAPAPTTTPTTSPTPENINTAASTLSSDHAARGNIKELIETIQKGTFTQEEIRKKIDLLKNALQPHDITVPQDADLIKAIHDLSDILKNNHSIAEGLNVQPAFDQKIREAMNP